MGAIGGPELVLIIIIAVIVLGPRKLPEMFRMAGEAVRQLKSAASGLQDTLENEVEKEEEKA